MNILLVEDDEFKATDVLKVLNEVFPIAIIDRATSVTTALVSVTQAKYGLIVLDMSLPTFALSGPGGGGSPQGQGGLEVLRLAGKMKSTARFVIVTQYPDIELGGREIPLKSASKVLRNRFELNVTHCLPYDFENDSWRSPLRDALFESDGRVS